MSTQFSFQQSIFPGNSIYNFSEQHLKNIEQQMRSKTYDDRFLGDEEKLKKVVEDDYNELRTLGVSYEQISKKLNELVLKANDLFLQNKQNNFLNEIKVDNTFAIAGIQFATTEDQKCPFSIGNKPCHSAQRIITIFNKKLNETISFSELLIHLIGKHGFFGGRESKHRLNPNQVCRVLELESESLHPKKKLKTNGWQKLDQYKFSEKIMKQYEEKAKEYALKTINLDDNTNAYLLPFVKIDEYETFPYKGKTNLQMIEEQCQEKGLNKEQRNARIDFYNSLDDWDPMAFAFVGTGKTYLHIFNYQKKYFQYYTVEKHEVNNPITNKGIYVFELNE